ncbi:MAG: hypothetical protein EA383_12510 [Spirochaetaceae bacterium]|nr:MAG: hypothetical protein EA383_12510 [Spirochaetaceae bacterium]
MSRTVAWLKRMYLVPLALIVCVFLGARFTPYPELTALQHRPSSSVVTDRYGQEFAVLQTGDAGYRFHVSIDALPDHVIEAVLASEDRRYYLHPGIDPLAVLGRLHRRMGSGHEAYGGATIAVQLSRLIRGTVREPDGHPKQTVGVARLRDAWNALRLRARLDPEALLELYVNHIPFGFSVEGIDAAARFWFNTRASDLDTRQAYLLMAIPRNPNLYALHRAPERAVEAAFRAATMTGRDFTRVSLEHIAERARSRARRGPVQRLLLIDAPDISSLSLAHYVNRLTTSSETSSIRSTIDLDVQAFLVSAVFDALHDARGNRISDAAALVVENSTGEVLAYLGSNPDGTPYGRSYIDAVRVPRSPGSTIKPFLFALAFERGYTMDSTFLDEPTRFGNERVFIPFNFNRQFNGVVTAAEALGSSLNVPAVVLYDELGESLFSTYMQNLGFEILIREIPEAGLGAVLGAARTSLDELSAAYASIARGGVYLPLSFRPVDDRMMPTPDRRVVSEASAGQVREILSSASYRHLGFPADSFIHEYEGIILKTGTASQFTDILAIAASEEHTVAVWMGNLDGQTVIGRPGSSLPARVVLRTADYLLWRQ